MPSSPAITVQARTLTPPTLPVRLFSVDEYQQMERTGLLTEADDVELLRGLIVPKMTRNPGHDTAIDKVAEALMALLPPGWRVRQQSAIVTGDSQPEPDMCVLRGPADRYAMRHPGREDIALLIEVAESSLARDRGEKAELYALAEIAPYWIVNLSERCVEVYDDPRGAASPPHYAQVRTFNVGEQVEFLLEGTVLGVIDVAAMLPADQ